MKTLNGVDEWRGIKARRAEELLKLGEEEMRRKK